MRLHSSVPIGSLDLRLPNNGRQSCRKLCHALCGAGACAPTYYSQRAVIVRSSDEGRRDLLMDREHVTIKRTVRARQRPLFALMLFRHYILHAQSPALARPIRELFYSA